MFFHVAMVSRDKNRTWHLGSDGQFFLWLGTMTSGVDDQFLGFYFDALLWGYFFNGWVVSCWGWTDLGVM